MLSGEKIFLAHLNVIPSGNETNNETLEMPCARFIFVLIKTNWPQHEYIVKQSNPLRWDDQDENHESIPVEAG